MSIRGDVTLECDVKDCHAEHVMAVTVEDHVVRDQDAGGVEIEMCAWGWRTQDGKLTCPQCVEEGKA